MLTHANGQAAARARVVPPFGEPRGRMGAQRRLSTPGAAPTHRPRRLSMMSSCKKLLVALSLSATAVTVIVRGATTRIPGAGWIR